MGFSTEVCWEMLAIAEERATLRNNRSKITDSYIPRNFGEINGAQNY